MHSCLELTATKTPRFQNSIDKLLAEEHKSLGFFEGDVRGGMNALSTEGMGHEGGEHIQDEDDLKSHCSLLVIGIGPHGITRYKDLKS